MWQFLVRHNVDEVVTIVLVLALLLAGWVWRASRPLSKKPPRMVTIGQDGQNTVSTQAPPKIIWTFWHDAQVPEVVFRCIAGWRQLNPHYQVHLVTVDSMHAWLDEIPSNLADYEITKQADWLRLALLAQYGGVWIDASIIMTRPLDSWLPALFKQQQGSYVGFYLERYNSDPTYPLIENWFIAACPGDPFIRDWLQLFRTEVIDQGTEHYLNKLRQAGVLDRYRQQFSNPSYHTMHVAAQQLLHRDDAEQRYGLTLLRAEDMAFKLQHASAWRRRRLFWRLLMLRDRHLPPLIKLRGGERRKLEWYLQRHWYRRHSTVGRYLMNPPASSDAKG